jgi:D-amino-acid oxidase
MNTSADQRWERRTWPELSRLASHVPEAGIHFQKARILRREKDANANAAPKGGYDPLFDANPWYADMFPDHRFLRADELPAGYVDGAEFTSVCINTAIYLPWLVGQCRALGVVFRRAVLGHIDEASHMSHVDVLDKVVVINCSGLQACRLGGVMDKDVYPARGQTVIVRNEVEPMIALSGCADGDDELCYTMTRAAGGGTVIGGTYQTGNWDANPDPKVAIRIMKRAVEIQPELAGGKGIEGLDIIRHGVGLRPARTGGVRIETEQIGSRVVVHNYGHAGWGYQGSYGCAERVVELVRDIV